ncbi:MAG: hypothetical protein K8S16_01195 [Bacteroidales bacterium]|nr:hypothetical protein [Bacteroidales bacterium]
MIISICKYGKKILKSVDDVALYFFFISSTIRPISIEAGSYLDLLVNILATLLVFIFVFTRKGRMINRMEGAVMIGIYVVYMVFVLL